ncbi:MAG: diaminopimelate epimerase [candidate division Zixibacteria bacterium]|nr:diaminopimelate epimerase [candidate division Zixibacteria bacterium]
MKIKFTKMQALGNDYIYVDCFKSQDTEYVQNLSGIDLSDLAKKICHRNFGVGSDGLILIAPGKICKFRMIFYNPDGSEAEMCGNGIRCFARYLYDHGLSKKKVQEIETKAGVIKTEIIKTGEVFLIKADIGKPILEREKIPMRGRGNLCINQELKLEREKVRINSLSLGNPHTVIFVDEFGKDWKKNGAQVENHPIFPKRTNVEFVKILSPKNIRLKIWERGVGETQASGTGACAATVAGVLNHKLDRKVKAEFDHGELQIEWNAENDHLYMIGPAVETFSGVFEYESSPK